MSGDRRRVGAWIGVAAVLAWLIASRLAGLGQRLPYHDELTHVALGERLALAGDYAMDPPYHGPLLYHLEALVMRVAGPGVAQARAVSALAGLAAVGLLVTLLRRQAGPAIAGLAAVFAIVSPSWTYYSRFAAHDALMLLVGVAVSWAADAWRRRRRRAATWVAVLALTAGWCTKLNVLFLAGALAGWAVITWAWQRRTGASRPVPVRLPWGDACVATAVALTAMAAVSITSWQAAREAATPGGPLRHVLGRLTIDGVAHWWRMHDQQRLPGPADYYAWLILLYEPVLIVGAGLALWAGWRASGRGGRDLRVPLAAGIALAAAGFGVRPWLAKLSLSPLHLLPVPLLATLAVAAAVQAARQERPWLAWWIWLALTQATLYAIAGEKVPWLVVHVVLPLIPLAAIGIHDTWRALEAGVHRHTLAFVTALSLALALHGHVALLTYNRSNVGEPLVHVEYDPQAHAALTTATDGCLRSPGIVPCIVTSPEARWLAQWYLRWHPARDEAVTTDATRAAETPFVFLPVGTVTLDASHERRSVRFAAYSYWLGPVRRGHVWTIARFLVVRERLGARLGVRYTFWTQRPRRRRRAADR